MTTFLCVISALVGAFVGFFAGKPHWLRVRDLMAAVEAHNLSIAAKKDMTDAIERSHAGGGAWIDRLQRDNQRNGSL